MRVLDGPWRDMPALQQHGPHSRHQRAAWILNRKARVTESESRGGISTLRHASLTQNTPLRRRVASCPPRRVRRVSLDLMAQRTTCTHFASIFSSVLLCFLFDLCSELVVTAIQSARGRGR